MNRRTPVRTAFVLALCASMPVHAADFVYEGRLEDGGQPANGSYELSITPFADPRLGAPLAKALVFPAVEVVDGRFRLEFALDGVSADAAWLQLAVRAAGDAAAVELPGRTKAIAAPLIGACWSATGDSGSNPATNFLGTTDAQPLVLRTRNAQSLRIEPSMITFGSPALPITANVIGGSHANTVTAGVRGATIGGGGAPGVNSDPNFSSDAPNRVTDHYGSIGGGFDNQAGDDAGTVQDRGMATVAGGWRNRATGAQASIVGGYNNLASGAVSTIGGGNVSLATGTYATVAGGAFNAAEGAGAFVAGGYFNCAGAPSSLAAGNRAKVRPPADPGSGACASLGSYPGGDGDEGSFVWADAQSANLLSTGPNQFLVRATGGMGLNGGPINDAVELNVVADNDGSNYANLFLRQRNYDAGILVSAGDATGSASNNAAFYLDQYNGSAQTRRLTLAANGDFSVTAAAFKPGGGSWSAPSDARLKQAVEPLTGALARLLQLHGVSFEYREPDPAWRPAGRHIGFLAQEVQPLFPDWVGQDEQGYLTVGSQGFEALTVEALRELRAEKDAALTRLEAENAALRERLAGLEAAQAAAVAAQATELSQLRQQLAELRTLLAPQVVAGGR